MPNNPESHAEVRPETADEISTEDTQFLAALGLLPSAVIATMLL